MTITDNTVYGVDQSQMFEQEAQESDYKMLR